MCLRIFWRCWRGIFENLNRKSKSKSTIISAHRLTSSENEFAGIYRKIPALQDLSLES